MSSEAPELAITALFEAHICLIWIMGLGLSPLGLNRASHSGKTAAQGEVYQGDGLRLR